MIHIVIVTIYLKQQGTEMKKKYDYVGDLDGLEKWGERESGKNHQKS